MTAVWICAALLGLSASLTDLRSRQIPNWLTVCGAIGGILCGASNGWHSLGLAIAGLAAGYLILLPFHLLGAMGGGDVKLMAAFGALLGPGGVLAATVLAAIAGAVWALGAFLCGARTIPYAPALAAGAWAALLGGGL